MKNYKKLRYGGIAVALTALIVAAIVLFNVVISALATKYMWYLDMTPNSIYSLTDECLTVVRDGIADINEKRESENQKNGLSAGDEGYQAPAKVNIYFCAEPDNLMGNTAMRYIYETARELADKCDFINIGHLNWRYNPSSVAKYKTSGTTINSYSVIVDADSYGTPGTNWIAYSQTKFFANDSSGNTVGYNGERVLASAILSVSNADTPIAYVTSNHSEAFYDTALLDMLTYSGYKVETADLSDKDFEFSDQGRLLVIFNPRNDFSSGNDAGVDEIAKIDEFLDKSNSMMVFMDPTSPILPNLEEYLETWGIVFQRHSDADGNKYSYTIRDTSNSLSSDGYTVKGSYVKTGGLGNQIYSSMIKNGYSPSVIFENSMSISYSSTFAETRFESEEDSSKDYTYGYSTLNHEERYIYDVFTAPKSAVAIAAGLEVNAADSVNKTIKDSDGKVYTLSEDGNSIIDEGGNALLRTDGYFITAAGSKLTIVEVGSDKAKSIAVAEAADTDAEISPYRLMTMSVKKKTAFDQTGQSDPQNSYVLCCASTKFASRKYIESAVYGNSDVLASATTIMGREIVPAVGIDFKYFKSYDISDITDEEANQYTLLLSILPPVIVFGVGAFVLIRRRYS